MHLQNVWVKFVHQCHRFKVKVAGAKTGYRPTSATKYIFGGGPPSIKRHWAERHCRHWTENTRDGLTPLAVFSVNSWITNLRSFYNYYAGRASRHVGCWSSLSSCFTDHEFTACQTITSARCYQITRVAVVSDTSNILLQIVYIRKCFWRIPVLFFYWISVFRLSRYKLVSGSYSARVITHDIMIDFFCIQSVSDASGDLVMRYKI